MTKLSFTFSDDEERNLTVAKYPLLSDKGVNTKLSYLRKKGKKERPEWKKYWPQTPQPRNHHQPDFYKRRPGMVSRIVFVMKYILNFIIIKRRRIL